MTIDRWEDIKDQVKKNFEIEGEGIYEDEEDGGTETDFIEFAGPLGHLRLEFETRPVVLDTKTHFHKRIGSETTVERVYSPTEKSHSLKVYKYDESADEWIPFENNLFN